MRRCSSALLRRWYWRGCETHRPLPSPAVLSRNASTAAADRPSFPSAPSTSASRPAHPAAGLNAGLGSLQSSAPATQPPQLPGPHSNPRFVEGQLTRDFISASLYSASAGYFNTSNRIYTAPSPSSLDFSSLSSRDAYYQRLSSLYNEFDDCWLTPVELFKPHYAHSIARWILQQEQQQADDLPAETLRIVEVGGGNGTCAAGILDYLRDKQPQLYQRTHYTIVDFSTTNRQRQLISLASHLNPPTSTTTSSSTTAPRVDVLTMSMLDWSETIEQRVYVIGLEVLDNMPHDKVVQHNNQLYQTHVHSLTSPPPPPTTPTSPPSPPPIDPNQRYRESYHPVTDPFIHEYLAYQSHYTASPPPPPVKHSYGSLGNAVAVWLAGASERLGGLVRRRGAEDVVWVATTALLLFHVLHHFMPRHRLLLADFSSLPDTIGGVNGPIVSGREAVGGSGGGGEGGGGRRGRAKDYATYSIDLGLADIFFPTDFELLQFVYGSVRSLRAERDRRTLAVHRPRVLTNYEFMAQYAVEAAERQWVAEGRVGRWRSPTQTRGKFDPLLHDYVNVKMLVS